MAAAGGPAGEAANLITAVRVGRERLHYLNPVPLAEIAERWIDQFDRPRVQALHCIKHRAEEGAAMETPTFVYTTYIASTAARVWEALTDADLTAAYWGRNVSTWQAGSRWEHQRPDGSGVVAVAGTVLESVPLPRLVITFDDSDGESSRVTFTIESYGKIVRLTVVHTEIPDEENRRSAAQGWTAVLSNLKTLLETGTALPEVSWEMPASESATTVSREREASTTA